MGTIKCTIFIGIIAIIMVIVSGCVMLQPTMPDACKNRDWEDMRVQIGYYKKTGMVLCNGY